MLHTTIVRLIAFIEISIGSVTLFSLMTYSLFSIPKKPLNVFIFVLISSIISCSIGVGLFRHKNWARKTLIFFSGYVIITKILIFSGLLRFTGELITFIPQDIKSSISILYHSLIVLFFSRAVTKKHFS